MRPVCPPVHVVPEASDYNLAVQMVGVPQIGMFIANVTHARVMAESLGDVYAVNLPLLAPIDFGVGRRRCLVDSGRGFLLRPNQELDSRLPGNSAILVANVEADLVRRHLGDGAPGLNRSSLSTAAGARLFQATSDLWTAARRDGPDGPSIEGLRSELADAIVDCIQAKPTGELHRKELVARAEEYIRAHLGNRLSVLQIARGASTSARTLHRAFVSELGLTPMQYVHRERLSRARRTLLAASRRRSTVKQVALETGFAHLGRFSIAYQAAFGEPPSQTLRS
jgi:AraC-like DNA-binding protein